ncbi:MAG: amidohydrolase family protein [Acidobacteria bacterium]|nr:amidohydrolase family protein [Acidobacteriota bacterium]
MQKRHVWITIISVIVSVSLGLAQQTADTVLYNGKVLTVDSNFSTAEAVAVRGNRIVAVGTDDEVLRLAGPNALKIDLKGKMVIPGFINTHVHLESVGAYARELGARKTRRFPLNVRGMKGKDEVLQQIRDVIEAFQFEPGEWIFFAPNWTASQAEIIFDQLTAKELDKAAPNNPIVVRTGMTQQNINLVNGVAIEKLWAKYGLFLETYGRYWIDESGQPSGILEPPASRILWEDQEFGLGPKQEDVAPYYRKILIENYSSLGVTTLSGALNTSTVQAYQWLDERDEMPLRYAYGAMAAFHPGADLSDYPLGGGTDTVFISSMSARATDGGGVRMCISLPRNNDALVAGALQAENSSDMNRVAAQWFPRGQCDLDIEYSGGTRGAGLKGNYFVEWYHRLAEVGSRPANAHVSGERSVSMMISAWERIEESRPGAVKGWAFDHCNLVNPQDLPRAAKLELMFSCSPRNAVASDVTRGARSPLVAFGPEILHTYAAPFKSMIDLGINVSMEVEGGPGWWEGMEIVITRKDKDGVVWGADERLDRQTALRVATQNGANYILKGDQLGSIETGKFADLVILDRDFMTMPEEEISEMRPLLTMMGGKIVFLRTDFSNEHNLKPIGAEISTFEELQARRPGNE